MKIDRRNPAHWMALALFLLQASLGLLRRALGLKSGGDRVALYGHKLNGNLLAIYRYLDARPEDGIVPVFMTMDDAYARLLRSQGVRSIWACGPGAASLLSGTPALVSDHGLHSLQLLQSAYRRLGLRFFDVWHGIPFKGFDADDFGLQHRYDEIWVASDLNRGLYLKQFGFAPDQVFATGYARTDRLVGQVQSLRSARACLGLPEEGRLILFAPTWVQDAAGRSLYPFGCDEREFLGALSQLAAKYGASLILRSHLNSGDVDGAGYGNVYALPGARYPDTESILLVSDILICDWSSIAFDYLLLDRPAFFLDVHPPFRKGFSLGPQYRFGPVVGALEGLLSALEECLLDEHSYWQSNAPLHHAVKAQVYGGLADGLAAERCVQRLRLHVAAAASTGESSR